MPRRGHISKRTWPADMKYGDRLVTRLINTVMVGGKKSTAEKVCYKAFDLVHERTKKEPLKAFYEAMDNIQPNVEVKSRRVGGATYQVPMDVRPERRVALGLRWLVGYAKKRSKRSMINKLADEITDALENRGGAVKKREEVHKMAQANKAFSHYRW